MQFSRSIGNTVHSAEHLCHFPLSDTLLEHRDPVLERLPVASAPGGRGQGCIPDGAGGGRDRADQAPEVRLRNVDPQGGDLWVERPEGRCRGLFLVVQRRELDLDSGAGEPKSAPATGGEQGVRHGKQ